MNQVTTSAPAHAVIPCPQCQQPLADTNGIGWCKACGYCRSAVTPCPQCQQPLVDPNGIGWCKACGYCRSVAESGKKVAATPMPAEKTTPSAMAVTRSVLKHTPIWLMVTVVGVLALVGAAFAIERFLPMSPLRRAVITSSAMGVGVLLMFVGQFMALLRLAPDDPTLGFKDALFPFRLYGLVLKHLPGTQFSVYLGTWGLTATIAAAVAIGGLGHWFTYLPKSDNKNQPQKTTKKT